VHKNTEKYASVLPKLILLKFIIVIKQCIKGKRH